MTQLNEIKRFTSLNHNEEYQINEKTLVISSVKLHKDGYNLYSGTIDGEPFELDSTQLKRKLGVAPLQMGVNTIEITDAYIDDKCTEVVERMTKRVKALEGEFSKDFVSKVLTMAQDEILAKSSALREELTDRMNKQQATKSEQTLRARCTAIGLPLKQARQMAAAMGVDVEKVLDNMEQMMAK